MRENVVVNTQKVEKLGAKRPQHPQLTKLQRVRNVYFLNFFSHKSSNRIEN